MVPLVHQSYGRLGHPASKLLNELAILASSIRAMGKAQFVESALHELSVSLCRGQTPHMPHSMCALLAAHLSLDCQLLQRTPVQCILCGFTPGMFCTYLHSVATAFEAS